MTLLLTESFDAWPTNGGDAANPYIHTKWGRWLAGYATMQGGVSSSGANAARGFQTGRHGTGYAIKGGSGHSTLIEAVMEDGIGTDTIIVGYACKIAWPGDDAGRKLIFAGIQEKVNAVTALHLTVESTVVNGSNSCTVQALRSGTTPIGTTFLLPLNIWFYLEIKVKVHSTLGTVEVRMDGVTMLNLTNQNTRNGGTGIINSIYQSAAGGNPSLNYTITIDDYYLLNSAGSAPFNDFLGDVTIDHTQPSSNDTVAWTPSAGANWDCVSDAIATTLPVVSDYVSSLTQDQADLYNIAASSAIAPGTVLGVASYAYADKIDSGYRTIALTHDLSGTLVQSADLPLRYSLNGGPQYLRYLRELAPDGAAWSITKRNSLKIGIKARP